MVSTQMPRAYVFRLALFSCAKSTPAFGLINSRVDRLIQSH